MSISPTYKDWLGQCALLLHLNEESFVSKMALTNFWMFSFCEDKLLPSDAVNLYLEKVQEFGDSFPPRPEKIFMSEADLERILDVKK